MIAATTGRLSVSSWRVSFLKSCNCAVKAGASAGVAWLSSPRSPPAKNVFFPLVSTTPVMVSFWASSRSTVWANEVWNVSFMVLAPWSGSSIVSVTMPSASVSHAIMFVISDPLHNRGQAHAATDAQRHQAVPAA